MIRVFTMVKEGSQRIKYKNTREFCGKPLIDWTFETMKWLGFENRVITDFEAVKKIANDFNIEVLHEDQLPDYKNIKCNEKLKNLYKNYEKNDIFVLLQPISPIRDGKKILKWINEFKDSNYSCGFSVCKLKPSHYYIGGLRNYNIGFRDNEFENRVDVFVENGSFYIFRGHMLDENFFINENHIKFEDNVNIDLDTYEEWEIAENEYTRKIAK